MSAHQIISGRVKERQKNTDRKTVRERVPGFVRLVSHIISTPDERQKDRDKDKQTERVPGFVRLVSHISSTREDRQKDRQTDRDKKREFLDFHVL